MTEHTIVVGYDGSEQSKKALEYAKGMAQQYQAKLSLVHVIDWSPFEIQTMEDNETREVDRQNQIRADREKLFPPILEELHKADIPVDVVIDFGHPAEEITRVAHDSKALGIVVGRRGMSTLKRVLFGGVASALVHEADVPVTIVP